MALDDDNDPPRRERDPDREKENPRTPTWIPERERERSSPPVGYPDPDEKPFKRGDEGRGTEDKPRK